MSWRDTHMGLLISVAALLCGCTAGVDSDRPCRKTVEGWICEDAGQTPDVSTTDTGESGGDMALPDEDMSVAEDMSAPPDEGMMMQEEDMAPPPPTSCVELRDRGESTGTHEIFPPGSTDGVQVHCDMDTDGGGWMLIARSVSGGTGNFGWRVSTGSVDDDGQPYSLGLTDVAFSEMLVTNHGGGKTPSDRIYRLDVPADFWTNCETQACEATYAAVQGPCNDPVMLGYTGRNQATDRYFFRDLAEDASLGLFPDGFALFYDDCRGGELNGVQGLIFVR